MNFVKIYKIQKLFKNILLNILNFINNEIFIIFLI